MLAQLVRCLMARVVTKYEEWPPATQGESRRLIMAHTFGRHLMENVREHALSRIPEEASLEARALAEQAVTDTLYGFVMLLDGVFRNWIDKEYFVDYRLIGRIFEQSSDKDEPVETFDVEESGDGLCIGFHMWMEGDFGDAVREVDS